MLLFVPSMLNRSYFVLIFSTLNMARKMSVSQTPKILNKYNQKVWKYGTRELFAEELYMRLRWTYHVCHSVFL